MSHLIQSPLRELVEEPSKMRGAALVKRVEPIGATTIADPTLELNNQELPLPKWKLERSAHNSPSLSTPTLSKLLVGLSLWRDEKLSAKEEERPGGVLGGIELVDEGLSLLFPEEERLSKALMGRSAWFNKEEREAFPRDGDELREQLNSPRLKFNGRERSRPRSREIRKERLPTRCT